MKVAVIGTGYVGLVSGTCFAEIGHDVVCIDIDEHKIEKLKVGQSPIYEPGLEELLQRNIQANRLSFSTDFQILKDAHVIFLAVGTPSKEDGSADLQYIYNAAQTTAEHKNDSALIVIKSTVPVGTASRVKQYLLEKNYNSVSIVSNPEFLKEGSAIDDFMRPDRVVIGAEKEEHFEVMKELYAPLVRQGNPIYSMSNLSAEVTKYAANCFLATKISFINEMAKLCEASGADIEEVRMGITSDRRIGKHFLYPGPGYGGSCFPKDVRALVKTAREYDSPLELVEIVDRVNEEQKNWPLQKLNTHFKHDLKGKRIALWGVSFKPNTDDIREASSLRLVQNLLEQDASVTFYDPVAANNFMDSFKDHNKMNLLTSSDSKYDCLNQANALVIMTDWAEFKSPDYLEMTNRMTSPIVIDSRNLYIPQKINSSGMTYISLGRQN